MPTLVTPLGPCLLPRCFWCLRLRTLGVVLLSLQPLHQQVLQPLSLSVSVCIANVDLNPAFGSESTLSEVIAEHSFEQSSMQYM